MFGTGQPLTTDKKRSSSPFGYTAYDYYLKSLQEQQRAEPEEIARGNTPEEIENSVEQDNTQIEEQEEHHEPSYPDSENEDWGHDYDGEEPCHEYEALLVSDGDSQPGVEELSIAQTHTQQHTKDEGVEQKVGDDAQALEESFSLIIRQLLEAHMPDMASRLEALRTSHMGDARLLGNLARGQMLFDAVEKQVYLWGGQSWEKSRADSHLSLLSDLLIPCYKELQTELKALQPQGGEDERAAAAERKWAYRRAESRISNLGSMGWLRGVADAATALPDLSIWSEQWDRKHWLLPCPNGVIDLRTGECSDGRPEDYMRSACPTEWHGLDAPAPRFHRFLSELFEDRSQAEREAMTAFLQRLMGYALAGQVKEHVLAVLYGEEGRNGKDTLTGIISHVLGDMAAMVSKDVMLDAGRDRSAGAPTPHLKDLQGKRLVFASEPERSSKFNVAQLKELTGGGEITARAPYAKEMTRFMPTHTIFLLTNHKPHADAHDTAFWRRVLLITFNMQFVDDPAGPNERKKDIHLRDALEQEAPGILAWLVHGCLEWQRSGLAVPDAVRADVEAYRNEEDTVQLFIDECCITVGKPQVKASRLYQAYNDWCRDGNFHPCTKENFGRLIKKKGIVRVHTREGKWYEGIGLRASIE